MLLFCTSGIKYQLPISQWILSEMAVYYKQGLISAELFYSAFKVMPWYWEWFLYRSYIKFSVMSVDILDLILTRSATLAKSIMLLISLLHSIRVSLRVFPMNKIYPLINIVLWIYICIHNVYMILQILYLTLLWLGPVHWQVAAWWNFWQYTVAR